MRPQPEGVALMEIAETTEQTGSADADTPAGRYAAAMIRNARAIAARQKEAGQAPADAELAALKGLLDMDGDVKVLNRELAARIRVGNAPAGTHAHLLTVTRANLAESNPRYLTRLENES